MDRPASPWDSSSKFKTLNKSIFLLLWNPSLGVFPISNPRCVNTRQTSNFKHQSSQFGFSRVCPSLFCLPTKTAGCDESGKKSSQQLVSGLLGSPLVAQQRLPMVTGLEIQGRGIPATSVRHCYDVAVGASRALWLGNSGRISQSEVCVSRVVMLQVLRTIYSQRTGSRAWTHTHRQRVHALDILRSW
jgi:hypothetical protein